MLVHCHIAARSEQTGQEGAKAAYIPKQRQLQCGLRKWLSHEQRSKGQNVKIWDEKPRSFRKLPRHVAAGLVGVNLKSCVALRTSFAYARRLK